MAATPFTAAPTTEFYCTDGHCTHEQVHLSNGLVMDNIIECPGHNGQFDYRTGEAKRSPACVDLKTYDVEVRSGDVYIDMLATDHA